MLCYICVSYMPKLAEDDQDHIDQHVLLQGSAGEYIDDQGCFNGPCH